MPPRRGPGLLAFLVLALLAPAAGAQAPPAFAPINPAATSRSGLYFQPYRDPRPRRWSAELGVDYANVLEVNRRGGARYTLDAELLRVGLRLGRDLGANTFVLATAEAGGVYGGFLDGFLDWYHGLLGIRVPEREGRPRGIFRYDLTLPGGSGVARRAPAFYLGDLRLGAGVRLGPHVQTVASLTLPTSTGPEGYGRGTASLSAMVTVRAPLRSRLVYEGSAGLGYTPTHGRLAAVERTGFATLSSGLAFRPWGRQWLYANLFYHSPYYHDTTLPALDRRELSLDFGWMLKTAGGREWRVGLTEDPEPGGPGVDLIVRLGASY